MSLPGGMVTQLLLVLVGVVLGSFLIGAFNPATVLARLLGKDLRGSGSGNPGATNAGRVLGVKWGIIVGVLDIAKGYLPVFVAARFAIWLACLAGIAVVAGHVWSPFLRGRGGKGVATTLGVLLALVPWVALIAFGGFAVAFAVVRRTGLASVVAALLVLASGVCLIVGWPVGATLVGVCLIILALIVLVRHRSNVAAWWRLRRHG